MADFLLEIGCEEIPARMIDEGGGALWQGVRTLLEKLRLSPDISDPSDYGRVFTSPRRISVQFPGLLEKQPDSHERVVGPSLKVAYKDGVPTPATLAFAKKVGQEVSQLKTISTEKGEYISADVFVTGRPSIDLLAEMLPSEIFGIPWPKAMYWKKKNDRFVRPIRWIVGLLDKQIIPLDAYGVHAGNQSRGHRILANHGVSIPQANSYVAAMTEAKVLSREAREHQIRKALDAATRTVPSARWREDKELLETVVNLTEFPSAILGNFEHEFLALPEEVLVTVMRDHQKYFAVEDTSGKLLPHFLAVLNTDGDASGVIRHGHERVLRARFNDARFFWQTDQKISLLDRVPLLRKVTFQKELGSYYEKTIRVQCAASWLSEIVRQNEIAIRPGIVHKAAYMAKADLTTELVKEFTELQGIVGGLYTRAQEIDPYVPAATRFAIGDAIYDHYKPKSIDDSSPRTIEGAVLSIADKADSIAGMFALGLQPTGSKDPFALRRQANGVVKAIADHKLPLNIERLFRDALAGYAGSEAEKKFGPKFAQPQGWAQVLQSILTFVRERLEFYLRDALGFAYDVVNAVLAAGSDDVVDAAARAKAVAKVRPSPDFESISVAFKRMKNILRQARELGSEPAAQFHPGALKEPAEVNLAELIPATAERVRELRARKNYEPALAEISRLRPAVDTFFDKVMVMVDEPNVRASRLALLQTVLREFSTIADFSEIVTESKESKVS